MKALILLGAMLIAGCSASISSQPSAEPAASTVSTGIHGDVEAKVTSVLSIGNGAEQSEIVDFLLADGTRCVSLASYKTGAGITCDWHEQATH